MKALNYLAGLAVVASLISVSGCKREFDSPPEKVVPEGSVMDIKTLKAKYNNAIVRFTDDASIYGVVTADEKGGNFYKQVYVQDSTGAILINLMSSGGVYRGDSVRLALKGARLIYSSGMYQLDSMNVDNNIFKQAAGKVVNPKTVTMAELQSIPEKLKGVLVKLDGAQFSCNDVGTTYADAVTFATANKTIEVCDTNLTVLVRTSGYANFAGSPVKAGKGSITGIISVYNTTPQMYVRDLNDIQISDNNADRCVGTSCAFYLKKNFEDGSLTSSGWTNVNVNGSVIDWKTTDQYAKYGSYYGVISNYDGTTKHNADSWLISPAIDLNSATTPVLTFENATKYTGPAMELFVSVNYNSGMPSTATWTPLTYYTSPTGNFDWKNSGNINLSSYKSANTRIAFRYTGSTTAGATWEIDDITIKEQ